MSQCQPRKLRVQALLVNLDGDDEAAREVATVFAAPTPLTDADAEELARLKVWRENVLSAKRKQTKNSS